jgi:enoyl-CoA hydratase/carnithine racemase
VNSITADMLADLQAHVLSVSSDPAIRIVVLRGAGKHHFTSGIDSRFTSILAPTGIFSEVAGGPDQQIQAVQDILRTIERSPKIYICAIKGSCFGAGLELATACDLRVASHDARLAMPDLHTGLLAQEGTLRLTRIMGRSRALSFMLLGEPIDAPTACQAGLIDQVVPPGEADAAAMRLAAKLAGYAPQALAWVKQAISSESAEAEPLLSAR